jgi:cell division protein FtsL
MAATKNRKLKVYLFAIIFIVGVLIVFFNDQGVMKYLKLKDEVNSLKDEINQLQEDNKKLEAEIDSLKQKVPAKIEKTAREKYDMIREGEKVIEVKEE